MLDFSLGASTTIRTLLVDAYGAYVPRNKSSTVERFVIWATVVLVTVVVVPPAAAVAVVFVAVVLCIAWLFSPNKEKPELPIKLQRSVRRATEATPLLPPSVISSDESDAKGGVIAVDPVHVSVGQFDSGYRIPVSLIKADPPRWLDEGEYVDIGPWRVPGGLINVGLTLRRGGDAGPPFLIDPTLPVAHTRDYVHEALPYWPSYDALNAKQRGAYLRWLIHGRRDPSANIGFVFLYFYGLEQRAMELTQPGDVATEIIPRIVHEVRALLAVYGKNNSFEHYANTLLSLIGLTHLSEKLYEHTLSSFPFSYDGLPLMLRVLIGQAARDGVPLAAPLALAVLRADPQTNFRTPATRCQTEFGAVFKHRNREIYGHGMHLPNNATKFKLEYRPASSRTCVKAIITDLPDINALRKPLANLRELAESVTLELEPFSRYLGRGSTALPP